MNSDINVRFDNKINAEINNLLNIAEETYIYTKDDLDKPVNSEETLEEYIRDTEKDFNLPKRNLKIISCRELNSYIKYLDGLWGML